MEETKCNEPNCPGCRERAMQDAQDEEMGFAVLVSLIPLLVLTLFSNMSLI